MMWKASAFSTVKFFLLFNTCTQGLNLGALLEGLVYPQILDEAVTVSLTVTNKQTN
jgi:hypothetical protein